MSFNFNIPLPLLESLQVSFEKEGKKLAETVAKSLGLPTQEVIKKVFKKTQITVYDWDAPPLCDVIKKDKMVYVYCGKPCLLGTTKCMIHQREISQEPPQCKKVRKLVLEDTVLWLDETTSKVYSSDGEYTGWFKNNELYLAKF